MQLNCGVLFLADVFEKFRNNSLKHYGLCYGLCLSWDTMLNMKKIELELIPDPYMFIIFEKGMRGGISFISNRYSQVSNKYLKSYDPKQ